MRVVVAPDGFGGTLSPLEAAGAIADGVRRAAPAAEVVTVPLSDGGPGLVEVLAAALPGARAVPATVTGPRGRPAAAQVLVHGPTAYVESAQACGLHLLAADERDPRRTTTAGVGELLSAALDEGVRHVVVGLGGSATDDGGAGMLAALGLRPVDAAGRPLPAGAPVGVARLDGVLDPRLARTSLVLASDVDAPLLGPRGATAVFAPQKGALPQHLPGLEAALEQWAGVLEAHLDVHVRDEPGAGAAGGLGLALLALGGRRQPGVGLVSELVGLGRELDAADLVLTGEGTLDGTSVTGKVVAGVSAAAAERGLPCVVLAGQVRLGRREQGAAGISGAYAVADAAGLEASLNDPAGTLSALAAQVAREWLR